METPLPPNLPMEQTQRKTNRAAKYAGGCAIATMVIFLIELELKFARLPFSHICGGLDWLVGLAGIALGIAGLSQINHHPFQKGKGWAIAGIGVGVLRLFLIPLIPILLWAFHFIGKISTRLTSTHTVS